MLWARACPPPSYPGSLLGDCLLLTLPTPTLPALPCRRVLTVPAGMILSGRVEGFRGGRSAVWGDGSHRVIGVARVFSFKGADNSSGHILPTGSNRPAYQGSR